MYIYVGVINLIKVSIAIISAFKFELATMYVNITTAIILSLSFHYCNNVAIFLTLQSTS